MIHNSQKLVNEELELFKQESNKKHQFVGMDAIGNTYNHDGDTLCEVVSRLVETGQLCQISVDYQDLEYTLLYNTNFYFVALNA